MKIVIDVPDYVVEKEMYICYFKAWGETLESTFDKAEPLSENLDKIIAEIKSMEYHMIDCEVLVSQEEVLELVEKYKKGNADQKNE